MLSVSWLYSDSAEWNSWILNSIQNSNVICQLNNYWFYKWKILDGALVTFNVISTRLSSRRFFPNSVSPWPVCIESPFKMFESTVDCEIPHNPADIILTLSIILGIILSYLPQHLRIVKLGSSEGISPWYLLMGGVASVSNLTNVAILQAPYLSCCTFVVSHFNFNVTILIF